MNTPFKTIVDYALQCNNLQKVEEILQRLESLRFLEDKEYSQSLAQALITISNHKAALDEEQELSDGITQILREDFDEYEDLEDK